MNYNKEELDILADIEILVQDTKCTREVAVLALIDTGRINGMYNDTFIEKCLKISNHKLNLATHKFVNMIRAGINLKD